MKFSVIIPTLNESRWIGSVLEALSQQSVDRGTFEILIVDCGSVDDTMKIAREFGARVESVSTRSPYVARNRGIEIARADWLAFLDGACIPDREWLSELHLSATSGQLFYVAGRTEQRLARECLGSRLLAHRISAGARRRNVLEHNGVAACNMLVHRSVFARIGPFESARSGGDGAQSRKAAAAGFRIGYAAGAIVSHPCDLSNMGYLKRRYRVARAQASRRPRSGNLAALAQLPWRPPMRLDAAVVDALGGSSFSFRLFLWAESVANYAGLLVGALATGVTKTAAPRTAELRT